MIVHITLRPCEPNDSEIRTIKMRNFPWAPIQIPMNSSMVNILFVLLIAAGVAINESDAFREAVMACKEEFKISREQVMAGDDSEQLKCFSECIMKKAGIMDADGKLNEEKIKEEGNKFSKTDEQKQAFETAMKSCLAENEASNLTGKCEKGYTFFKCIRQNAMTAMKAA